MTQDRKEKSKRRASRYGEKLIRENALFSRLRPGDRIFIGSGCSQPRYLLEKLAEHIQNHPKIDHHAEIMQIWALGLTPELDERLYNHIRLNAFLVGPAVENSVKRGSADIIYTPLSLIPALFNNRWIEIDLALIQTTPPDRHGHLNLGIHVDIIKAAIKNARYVVAQLNRNMPQISGDGEISIDDVNALIEFDEPLMEWQTESTNPDINRIGSHAAALIKDGDTLQIGLNSLCQHMLAHLDGKKDLGVHTIVLTDGLIDLIKKGVITNKKKSLDRGRSIATCCMGSSEGYKFLNNNPSIFLKDINKCADPHAMAKQRRMTAVNSAYAVDLSGQVATGSFEGGAILYSPPSEIIRSAAATASGKTVFLLSSIRDGKSTIMPQLPEGSVVDVPREDVHFIVTEQGCARLKGKSLRERALSLISIAHPNFQSWLVKQARSKGWINTEQLPPAPYPAILETIRTTHKGLTLKLRPVRFDDTGSLRSFFHALSDKSLYRRFLSSNFDISMDTVQHWINIDYNRDLVFLATVDDGAIEKIVGVAEYHMNPDGQTAEIAFAVHEEYQNRGIATELFDALCRMAKKAGLSGFTAEVLDDNLPMLRVFERSGHPLEIELEGGVNHILIHFEQRWDFSEFF